MGDVRSRAERLPMAAAIDLYQCQTPNRLKSTTSQEEVELPYHVTPMDIPAYEAVRARVSEEQHKQ